MAQLWELLRTAFGIPAESLETAMICRILGAGSAPQPAQHYITTDNKVFCTSSGLAYRLKEV